MIVIISPKVCRIEGQDAYVNNTLVPSECISPMLAGDHLPVLFFFFLTLDLPSFLPAAGRGTRPEGKNILVLVSFRKHSSLASELPPPNGS